MLRNTLLIVCLVLVLLRIAGALQLFASPPVLRAAIIAFGVTFLAAFVTGVVQSIPACAGPLWLNLHRAAAALAAITCAVAARFVAAAHHP